MKFPLQKLDLKAFSVPGRLKGRTAIEEYQRVVADCPIYCGDGVLPKASRWQKPVPTMTPQSPIRHCVDEDLAGLWVVLEIIHAEEDDPARADFAGDDRAAVCCIGERSRSVSGPDAVDVG